MLTKKFENFTRNSTKIMKTKPNKIKLNQKQANKIKFNQKKTKFVKLSQSQHSVGLKESWKNIVIDSYKIFVI